MNKIYVYNYISKAYEALPPSLVILPDVENQEYVGNPVGEGELLKNKTYRIRFYGLPRDVSIEVTAVHPMGYVSIPQYEYAVFLPYSGAFESLQDQNASLVEKIIKNIYQQSVLEQEAKSGFYSMKESGKMISFGHIGARSLITFYERDGYHYFRFKAEVWSTKLNKRLFIVGGGVNSNYLASYDIRYFPLYIDKDKIEEIKPIYSTLPNIYKKIHTDLL